MIETTRQCGGGLYTSTSCFVLLRPYKLLYGRASLIYVVPLQASEEAEVLAGMVTNFSMTSGYNLPDLGGDLNERIHHNATLIARLRRFIEHAAVAARSRGHVSTVVYA